MKTNCLIFLLFTLIMIPLTGCSKKCESFNNEILEWMPYKVSDKIVIYNNGFPDTLTVNSSEINYTNKIAYGAKCICENSFYLNLSSSNFIIYVLFNNSHIAEQSEIIINQQHLNYSEQSGNMEINGKMYTDLLIYKNIDQTRPNVFKEVVISRSIGIVAIYQENNMWTIEDNAIKTIEIKDLNFKMSDC